MATLSRFVWAQLPSGQGIELRRLLVGIVTISGGVLVVGGTLLPWLSFFAGLQTLSGLAGANGRILLIGGVLSIIAGSWSLARFGAIVRWVIGLLGFTLLAFAGWLSLQLVVTYRQLSADPMMVAALGPGLFVALGGAALIFATLFFGDA